jgi:hypothetical protein
MQELTKDGEFGLIDEVSRESKHDLNCIFCRSEVFMPDENAAQRHAEKEAAKLKARGYLIASIKKIESKINERKCYWHHIYITTILGKEK